MGLLDPDTSQTTTRNILLPNPLELLVEATVDSLDRLDHHYPELFMNVYTLANLWIKEDRKAIQLWGHRKIQAIWAEASKRIYQRELEQQRYRNDIKIAKPLVQKPFNIWDGKNICLKTTLSRQPPNIIEINKSFDAILNNVLLGAAFKEGLTIIHKGTHKQIRKYGLSSDIYEKLIAWIDIETTPPEWKIKYDTYHNTLKGI